jgi:hypothetical protein
MASFWESRASKGAPRRCVLLAIHFVVTVLLGCRKPGKPFPAVRLRGSITTEGQPIPSGTIMFLPEASGQAASGIITNGQYKADAVPIGTVRVLFHAIRETGKIVEEGGHRFPERLSIIPQQYASGIVVEVGPETATLDFDL